MAFLKRRIEMTPANNLMGALASVALALLPCGPALTGPILPVFPTEWSAIPTKAAPTELDALLWLAQSTCEFECGPDYEPGDRDTPSDGRALNSAFTNVLVRIISDANDTCDTRIDLIYRIDCLRIYYGWVADALPDNGDYLPIKKAMRRAEKKLDAIVTANLDTDQPAITPKDGHKKYAKRLPPVRAVKKSAAPKAAVQAAAVVNETELLIIRSGGDPARREPHYTEVAAAVEDNLVILRSA
jgi:hypothetical protein